MRVLIPVLFLGFLIPLSASAQKPATEPGAIPLYVVKAVNDPERAADRDNDARRQMIAVMTFTRVKPGDKVMELIPATGYWTRVFSQIVGKKGHVYTIWPTETEKKFSVKDLAMWQGLVKTQHYDNVSVLLQSIAMPHAPTPVDLVFTDDNYHDLHDPFFGPVNMAKFNKDIYDALKPGGTFVIVDHQAPAGSGTSDTNTLHRIDPAAIKKEVEAAGFVFDGSSDALYNPGDPLTIPIFDKSIRGHTSQVIYRFLKPLH
ncbi:MAG: class I SAM-dependent methyltransferase [Gammaproteobacteria bacterium]